MNALTKETVIRGAFLPGLQPRMSVAYRVMAGAHCPVVTCR